MSGDLERAAGLPRPTFQATDEFLIAHFEDQLEGARRIIEVDTAMLRATSYVGEAQGVCSPEYRREMLVQIAAAIRALTLLNFSLGAGIVPGADETDRELVGPTAPPGGGDDLFRGIFGQHQGPGR